MTPFSPHSKFARVIDLTLDLLITFILLGAPLIFYTKGHDVFEFNKITAVRNFSALAASLFLAKLLFVRPLKLTRSPLDIPLLAWLAVALVCTFNTVNIRLSLHGVYEDFEGITTLVNYAFLLFLMQNHVRSSRQVRQVIGAIIIAGTVAGFYGMLQNFGIDFVPWNPSTYSADRMFSTMGNPNFLAAYLVMSLPVCLVVFLDLPDRIATDKGFCGVLCAIGLVATIGLCLLFKVNYFNFDPAYYGAGSFLGIFITQKFWVMHILLAFPLIAAGLLYYGRLRLVLLVSMVFQVVAILFTKSRGGGVSLAVILIIFAAYFLWDLRRGSAVLRRNRYWLSSFFVLIALAHLIPDVRETTTHMFGRIFDLLSFSNVKLTPRLYIWRSALQMLQDHFWFGTGLDTFQISFPEYRTAIYWILEWNGTPEKAHNLVMQVAATMGFMGLFTFFWLNTAFVMRAFKDLMEQADSSRRLLVIGCFAGAAGFFVQDLFSFTVVGYGVTYWMLLGFIPAMQRTWLVEDQANTQAPQARPSLASWRVAVALIALTGLACLLVGSQFKLGGGTFGFRALLALAGLAALIGVLLRGSPAQEDSPLALALLAPVSLGLFLFAVHSTRIWVADSFYKQGQVGMGVNNPGYAALMYQKAAGRIEIITPQKEQTLLLPATATAQAGPVTFTAGLNPDQELYWVKMGIAFETAAAQAPDTDTKLRFFRTALAIHQLTLEMNPINGYNFNNKGRVLKSMGEAFGSKEFFLRALDHYREAIRLDPNNVYFNLDHANTFINLGDFPQAMQICESLMKKFDDFAVPYSYAGFISLRQNKVQDAIRHFETAIKKDWKRDQGSRALAAVNLGILQAQQGKDMEAQGAYMEALSSNPDFPEAYMNFAQLHLAKGRRQQAVDILMAYRRRNQNHAGVNQLLKQLGVSF